MQRARLLLWQRQGQTTVQDTLICIASLPYRPCLNSLVKASVESTPPLLGAYFSSHHKRLFY